MKTTMKACLVLVVSLACLGLTLGEFDEKRKLAELLEELIARKEATDEWAGHLAREDTRNGGGLHPYVDAQGNWHYPADQNRGRALETEEKTRNGGGLHPYMDAQGNWHYPADQNRGRALETEEKTRNGGGLHPYMDAQGNWHYPADENRGRK